MGDATEARLRAVLDSLPAGVVAFDAADRLLYANPALWRQVGEDVVPLPPGSTLEQVATLMATTGHYGPGDPAEVVRAVLALDRRRPRRRLARNHAGRWHEMTSDPLPGGGFVSLSSDVTGLHRTEPEALARAALLDTILERLSSGVAEYDAEGRLRYFNPAYLRLTGHASGGLRLGMTLAEVFATLEGSGQFANLTQEQRADLPWGGLHGPRSSERQRPDGVVLWTRSTPIPQGGNLVEVDEITPLRRAEEEVRHRALLLDAVLAALPDGVCVYGPDKRVTMVNAAYQRIMAGAEVAIGEHHDGIVARRLAQGEYDPEAPAAVMRALEEGHAASLDRVRIRPDGTVLSVRAGRLPDGGHITVMTDITARHRAEREAERRATTLRDMLDNQTDGVALFDAEGRLIAANALAARRAGLRPEEMRPGRTLAELRDLQLARDEFGVQDSPTAAEFAGRAGTSIADLPRRYVRRRPDGSLLEVRTDPTPEGGFIRTYRDVTEEYQVRSELERARDAAEGASRAKSGFLAAVTHELRTPLNAVIGFSEAILEEPRAERMRAHAAEVLAAGRQLLALVDGILATTRLESGQEAVTGPAFDPAPVLRAAAADAMPALASAGLTLTLDVPRRLPHVKGEQRRLRQVLDALLSNAVKFTPAGGTVTISSEAEDGTVVARVSDTGIGMEPSAIARAFEAFTQLESGLARRFAGSGLGLYLARALSTAMGMDLALESAPGAGTTAVLRMRADAPAPAPPALAPKDIETGEMA